MRRGRWLEVCWYGALAALAAAAQIQFARGAEYVVAPGGSDAGAGSSSAPWATLQKAADVVGPGDRVVVKAGNYKGFYLDTSGTAGSPIEFFAEPGVLINTPTSGAGNRDGINLELASHIILDGFSIAGMPRSGVRSVGNASNPAEFVTIRNVHAYDNGTWGIFTGFVDDVLIENNETSGSKSQHGIYVSNSGDRPVIRNNLIWGNRGAGIHMNGDASLGGDGLITGAVVTGNEIYGNAATNGSTFGGGSAINMDGVQDSLVANNLLYDNHASGISLFQGDGAEGSTGNLVINNTIHQAVVSRWALNIQNASTDNTVLNNIIVSEQPTRGAINISANSLPNFVSDYNAVISRFTTNDSTVQTLAQWQASTGQDAHSFVATPAQLFEDWTTGDYRLRSGSPAIDTGTATNAPTIDIAGTPRPAGAGFDIGAYEVPSTGGGVAGDFTGDGIVDGADLAAWKEAFGVSDRGDANGDDVTDGSDFLIWQRALDGQVPTAAAVPEPVSCSLLLTSFVAMVVWRRR